MHYFDGRIGGIADAEDQLKLGIILFAVTAKALPDFRIDTFQWLEDGDRWQLAFWQRSLLEFFAPGAEKAG